MFYEDSKMDLEKSLRKLADFLEHPLKDEDLPKLIDHLQFENIKKNKSINFKFNPEDSSEEEFVRQGTIGSNANPEITEDISKKFEEWTSRNLQNSEFKFPHW